ncbi:MAG: tRNA pseudouridine(38-40) synthase TruA [Bacteroidota bacterium]
MRYVLDISYHGGAYAGWQIQPNAHTVQAELEGAMKTFFGEEVSVMGAGRTDAGVHGKQLMVHFDREEELALPFVHSLNGILPGDLAVNALYVAEDPEFHARFSATHRAYIYQLVRKKSPLWPGLAMWVRHPLDLEAMQAAARSLKDYESFGSFCKAHGANKTNRCRIDHAYWEENGDLLCFHIGADRFLRGMVRAIVGTLLLVGAGKMSLEEFRAVIEAEDRTQAGPNAPAHGLFLTEVRYPEDSLRLICRSGI